MDLKEKAHIHSPYLVALAQQLISNDLWSLKSLLIKWRITRFVYRRMVNSLATYSLQLLTVTNDRRSLLEVISIQT